MLIDLCLAVICLFACAVALMAWACIRAGSEYDQWVEEFNRNGIQTALDSDANRAETTLARLEPVLMGSEVVGYTVVGERRQNR